VSKVKLDLKVLDKVIKRIERIQSLLSLKGGFTLDFRKALDEVGEQILKNIKAETPVGDDTRPDFHEGSQFYSDKKHLRDAWKWKLETKGTKIEGFIFVDPDKLNDLVDLIEEGSFPHLITAKAGSVLKFYVREGSGWKEVFTQSVNHPGFKANKFVERARLKSSVCIKRLVPAFQREMNKVILGRG